MWLHPHWLESEIRAAAALCLLPFLGHSQFILAGTCLQALLEEGDLLTQGVNSVQLLEGVGQAADGVCTDILRRRRHEVVEGGQHQLEFLLQSFHSALQLIHFFLHFTRGT